VFYQNICVFFIFKQFLYFIFCYYYFNGSAFSFQFFLNVSFIFISHALLQRALLLSLSCLIISVSRIFYRILDIMRRNQLFHSYSVILSYRSPGYLVAEDSSRIVTEIVENVRQLLLFIGLPCHLPIHVLANSSSRLGNQVSLR